MESDKYALPMQTKTFKYVGKRKCIWILAFSLAAQCIQHVFPYLLNVERWDKVFTTIFPKERAQNAAQM